ncbi:MAG TPA: hypothetical protein VIU64_11685, partial [Polyangia bacterium]
ARLSPEEASFWSIGVGIARGEEFPALGHSVSGTRALHPGPLFFWIIALSQIFVTSPLVAGFSFSMFGLLSVFALARAIDGMDQVGGPGRRDPLATVRAALARRGTVLFLFLLAAPWWVIYTNSTWPGYVMTSATACFVAALFRMIGQSRTDGAPPSRAAMPVGFLLVAGFQIHLSLLHYWPLALAVVVIFRPRIAWRWLAAGALIGAACYIPYLVHELRTHFSNTRLLMAKSQGGTRDLRTLAGLYLYFFGFPTTDISFLWQHGFWFPFDHFRFWGGTGTRQTTEFFRTAGPAAFLWSMHVLSWLVSLTALATGAGRAIVALRQHGARRPDAMAVVYVVALADIAGFYVLSGKGGYAHYASVLLPVAYFPVASFLAWIARSPAGRAAVAAYLALFALAGLLVMRGYYRVDSRWSAVQTERVVSYVLGRTRGADGRWQPFQLQFGFSPSWSYPYAVVARRMFHAPWSSQSQAGAPHAFFVGARDPAAPLPASADRLDLETIYVEGR